MSRFLFATIGSLGDLHPYIAIGRALVARGHEAAIACAEEYRAAVLKAGLEFAPARPNHADFGDYRKTVAKIFHSRRGAERLIRDLIMPSVPRSYEDIFRAAAGADLLVSHPLTLALQLVAQRRSLPWAATVLSPLSFMSCYDPPLLGAAPWLRKLCRFGPGTYGLVFSLVKRFTRSWEAPLRRFRRELGLPESNKLAMFEGQFSPLLNLALFDLQLASPQPDWPQNTVICGTPTFEGTSQDESAIDELDRFLAAGEAPIVFALGSSAVWIAGNFWEQATTAARELRRRAVLITGPTMPSDLPEGIKAFSYLPYSKVFPQAAVVVHQTGIGTLGQALRAGRPQLMLPLAFDQPDNARRAAALGVGRALPFAKANSPRLVTELKPLLSEPAYATRAATLAQDLKKSDGAASAADHLIACLKGASAALS